MRKPRTISAFMQLILSSERRPRQLNARNVRKGTETMYSNYESILAAIIHQDRGYYTTKWQLTGEQKPQEQHIEDRAIQQRAKDVQYIGTTTETWNQLWITVVLTGRHRGKVSLFHRVGPDICGGDDLGWTDRPPGTLHHSIQRLTRKMRDPGHRQLRMSSRLVLAVRWMENTQGQRIQGQSHKVDTPRMSKVSDPYENLKPTVLNSGADRKK